VRQPHRRIPVDKALTDREIQVMNSLCEGCTMEKIGERLGIHRYTVKFHLSRIYRKLDAVNGLHAVAIFTMNKLQQQHPAKETTP
jgi:DNA-binding CsgD family transcriptional regulator